MTFPFATSGPLELPRPSGIATSQTTSPVRVERDEMRVAQRQEQLVVIERHAAHREVDAKALLPDQIAGLAVERLDDAAGVVEEDGAVIRER